MLVSGRNLKVGQKIPADNNTLTITQHSFRSGVVSVGMRDMFDNFTTMRIPTGMLIWIED